MKSIFLSKTGKIIGLILFIILFVVVIMVSTSGKKTELPRTKSELVEDTNFSEQGSSYQYFMRSIIISIIVISLLLVLARILQKNVKPSFDKHLDMKIIGKRYIDQKHYLMLVKIAGKNLLLGVSDSSMNLISELDSTLEMDADDNEAGEEKPTFQNILNKLKL